MAVNFTTPREEGWASYFNGVRYKNPYPVGSERYNLFERGWSQALRQNPERLKELRRERWQQEESERLEKERGRQALEQARRKYLTKKGSF